MTIVKGQFIDLFTKRIYPAEICIKEGKIASIEAIADAPDTYILPGFVDAHIHIESSMLVPTAFAPLAVKHGTVATISDPHEIANVCGVAGVNYMIENAILSPLKFFFGAPSCVPATNHETAGAQLGPKEVAALLCKDEIWYLSEMMNYPGVLHGQADVMEKIRAAHEVGKPVDGHAPGLMGAEAKKYAEAGISTDHECVTMDEALDKIEAGMHILIREGSAAKNFEALCPLLKVHPDKVMFCSDDKHPDELLLHHINRIVVRALAKGYDLFDVLNAACVNPVLHYKVPVGLLRQNDPADFIIVESLATFKVMETWIDGRPIYKDGKIDIPEIEVDVINNFEAKPINKDSIKIGVKKEGSLIRVIEAIEGQLITKELHARGKNVNGYWESDVEQDILKMVVVNRYTPNSVPAVCFIKNIGLKQGAMASTVAHDCHNIIAVGVDNESIISAVNAIISVKGGISASSPGKEEMCMPLPVGGLMSTRKGEEVAADYIAIDRYVKALGSTLHAPFMTLSFMALLVIPDLKLSDKGLFSGTKFQFTDVEV